MYSIIINGEKRNLFIRRNTCFRNFDIIVLLYCQLAKAAIKLTGNMLSIFMKERESKMREEQETFFFVHNINQINLFHIKSTSFISIFFSSPPALYSVFRFYFLSFS